MDAIVFELLFRFFQDVLKGDSITVRTSVSASPMDFAEWFEDIAIQYQNEYYYSFLLQFTKHSKSNSEKRIISKIKNRFRS